MRRVESGNHPIPQRAVRGEDTVIARQVRPRLGHQLSAGIGYDIWKTPRKELSVKLGAGYLDEEYTTITNESAVAVWALRFRHEFLGGDFAVFHNHTITDNLSGRSNTIFKTSTGVNYAITDLLYSNVSLDFDCETHRWSRPTTKTSRCSSASASNSTDVARWQSGGARDVTDCAATHHSPTSGLVR